MPNLPEVLRVLRMAAASVRLPGFNVRQLKATAPDGVPGVYQGGTAGGSTAGGEGGSAEGGPAGAVGGTGGGGEEGKAGGGVQG